MFPRDCLSHIVSVSTRCQYIANRCVPNHPDFFKDYPPVNAGAGDDSASGPAIALGGPPAAGDSNPFDDDDGAYGSGSAPATAGAEPLYASSGGMENGLGDGEDRSDDGDDGGPPPDDAAPECEAVVAWRAEFAKRLEDKTTEERKVKAERAEKARETLMTMQKGWQQRCNAKQDANKAQEKELLRERDGVLARMSKPGEPPAWSVVPELVDMTGKFKEGARDTSRMRQVLLKMKTY